MAFYSNNLTSKPTEHLRCPRKHINILNDQSDWIRSVDITLCVFNSLAAITATIGNALVILAIWQTPTLRKPSNLILFFLAITDFFTGLITEPTFVIYVILKMKQSIEAYCIVAEFMAAVGFMLSGTSFSVLTAIGVDKFFAVRYHLRYKEIVTNTRIVKTGTIILICNACILTVFYFNYNVYTALIIILVVINFLAWCVCYAYVFRQVKRQRRRLERLATETARFHAGSICHLRRLERSTYTAVFIVGLYFICYVPFIVVSIFKSSLGYNNSRLELAHRVASTLVLLNATLNPIVYCLRLRTMRAAVVKKVCLLLTIKQDSETRTE